MDRLLRVLIVDDSPDDADLLAHQLRAGGYTVTFQRVDTAAAMQSALSQAAWDLVIADQLLPHFSASGALALLQSTGQDLPFFVVTGQMSEGEAMALMRAGAHDFIRKDQPARLIPALERELREAAARRDHRRAEEARRQSDTRYRDLFNNAPIPIWEQDFSLVKQRLDELGRQGVADFRAYFRAHPAEVGEFIRLVKIIDANNATLRLYHAGSRAEVISSLSRIIPRSAESAFVGELALIAGGGTEFECEGINYTLDGEPLDIILHWSAAPGYEATLAKVLVSIVDITARKRAEAAARQTAADLQAVFEAIPDLFFRLDAAGLILDCHAGRQARLDWPPQACLGKPLSEAMPAEAGPVVQSAVAQALRTGAVVAVEYAVAAPVSPSIFEARVMPLPNQQVVVLVRDVTEHKQMLAQVFNSQKLVDLGTLAAGVAHELNSPLQVITGLSQSLQTRLQKDEYDQEHVGQNLETIHRSGWRCAEIVRSLLTYARASTGQIQSVDLNALVGDTLLLTEHQLRSWSNITVSTDLAPDLPPLPCDRNQITQVLINLITNARDAMPEGGEIRLRTFHDPAGLRLGLEVSDNGTGIAPELREKIFEPFFTTKPAGQGTGLGLYIVAGIVRAYGGEMTVESTPGEGATFTLLFPEKGVPPLPAEAPTGTG
jgi:signal transduction histidine kinase